jgi:hypothetical protein
MNFSSSEMVLSVVSPDEIASSLSPTASRLDLICVKIDDWVIIQREEFDIVVGHDPYNGVQVNKVSGHGSKYDFTVGELTWPQIFGKYLVSVVAIGFGKRIVRYNFAYELPYKWLCTNPHTIWCT